VCDVGTKNAPADNSCPSGQYCSSCKCYTAAQPISCKANHKYYLSTGLNNFMYTTLPVCGDDCSDIYGLDYKCDLTTCTCMPKSVTSHTCGNNFKESTNEECDGYDDSWCKSDEVCSTDCACVKGTRGVCGDGVKQVNEQCDGADKALCAADQVCSTSCVCVAGVATSVCGNNVREATEACDGTDHGTCTSTQTCAINCVCQNVAQATCGNNVKEGAEQCDGTDRTACTSSQTCNQNCLCQTVQQQSVCGNQIIEAGEECEDASGCGAGYSCIGCACACTDSDSDQACDSIDNCPNDYNPGQGDYDGDGIGDVCDTVPVDCPSECSAGLANYALGQNNQAACNAKIDADMQAALNGLTTRTCFTTCKYSSTNSTYMTISMNNQVTFGCCCTGPVAAWKVEHACTDCPGQNPVCPDPDVVC